MSGRDPTSDSLARQLTQRFSEVGDIIETLTNRDYRVTLTVHFNGGAESMQLHHLSGELEVDVWHVTKIDTEPTDG